MVNFERDYFLDLLFAFTLIYLREIIEHMFNFIINNK